VRDGAIEALERMPECLITCTDAADPKVLVTSLERLAPRVLPGGTGAVIAKIKNVGASPVTLCLRLESTEATGWDRLSGVAPPKPDSSCERPRLPFPLRTLDGRDANVDELKLDASVICAKTIRTVLLPGRTLTKTVPWTALRLPPAPKPYEDDAGNKYYPKAIPTTLRRGVYKVEAELPFVDAPSELKRVMTTIEVNAE
jgi:hypothetical protein